MRIVVDYQSCQTGSRVRGIGRYSRNLMRAMIENAGDHEIVLALNGAHPDLVRSIREDFKDLLPARQLVAWQPLAMSEKAGAFGSQLSRAEELVREYFIANLNPDAVLVTSLFEGSDAITSIGHLPSIAPTSVILYDLIPLRFDSYLPPSSDIRNWYLEKLRSLKRASHLFAISEASRRDGLALAGLSPDRVTTIMAAAEPIFAPLTAGSDMLAEIRQRHAAPSGYVLYYGGFDPHKNVPNAIKAFAVLPPSLRQANPLLLVGGMPPSTQAELLALARREGLTPAEVRFVGRVDDDDLVRTIAAARVVIYPSFQEGFGLPVLEAMSVGAAVICSDSSSLPEIVGRSDAMFDPHSPASIAEILQRALTDEAFNLDLRKDGRERSSVFSWKTTACAVLSGLQATVDRQAAERDRPRTSRSVGSCFDARPRLAWITDRPPQGAGLASAVAALSAHYEIEVYCSSLFDEFVIAGVPLRSLVSFYGGNLDQRILVDCLDPQKWGRTYPAVLVVQDQDDMERRAELVTCLGQVPAFPAAESPIPSDACRAWADDAANRIEVAYRSAASPLALSRAIAGLFPAGLPKTAGERLQGVLLANRPLSGRQRLLVEVPDSPMSGTLGGIPRVIDRILHHLTVVLGDAVEVIPVHVRPGLMPLVAATSRANTSAIIAAAGNVVIEPHRGDVFLALGLNHALPSMPYFSHRLREVGGSLYAVVYDLMPLQRPDWFPDGVAALHRAWFDEVRQWDGLVCISKAVAEDVRAELEATPDRPGRPDVKWFHLGSELPRPAPTRAFPALAGRPGILHVSQIWRRKGHEQTLAAFEQIWSKGVDVSYIIVGRQGYGMDQFIERVRSHPERGRRLHWFDSPDDETLAQLYGAASGIIVPSEAEGFGLPLVEGIRLGCPALCRDLPVFREIIADGATFFSGLEPEALAGRLEEWVVNLQAKVAPTGDPKRLLSWKQSARALLNAIGLLDDR